jgi:hypothetical protein
MDQAAHSDQNPRLYAGYAADTSNGHEHQFQCKNLWIFDVYEDEGVAIAEALDGKQFQIDLSAWASSPAVKK